MSSTSYYDGNKESIQEAKDYIDTKEALAEARIQKGAWDIAAAIGTAFIVIASVAAIVASGGTATPLVMIALGSAIAYGASNVYEASEDIQYGLAGDIESVSLNPIQDTVFLGNEVAYDTWGMISTGISLGACTPMGSTQKVTAEGIKQAITKFLGSGASNIAKQSISFGGKSLLVAGSGMVTEALVTPYTSEDAGRLMGLMSGAFVASKVFGVKGIESKQKVKINNDASEYQKILNKFPQDNQTGKVFKYSIENGRLKLENGIQEVDFIVDMNGNLIIGRGHSYLANGKSVQAAGTIKVNSQGFVRNITNESGHYQPTVLQAKNYKQILDNIGLNVDNAWIRIGEFETSLSNYVIDKKIFYNGPIKYLQE